METMPGGKLASFNISVTLSVFNGVSSTGLTTIILSIARRGIILTMNHRKGKFHAIIIAHTRIDSLAV
jgi:hypothetical protein